MFCISETRRKCNERPEATRKPKHTSFTVVGTEAMRMPEHTSVTVVTRNYRLCHDHRYHHKQHHCHHDNISAGNQYLSDCVGTLRQSFHCRRLGQTARRRPKKKKKKKRRREPQLLIEDGGGKMASLVIVFSTVSLASEVAATSAAVKQSAV